MKNYLKKFNEDLRAAISSAIDWHGSPEEVEAKDLSDKILIEILEEALGDSKLHLSDAHRKSSFCLRMRLVVNDLETQVAKLTQALNALRKGQREQAFELTHAIQSLIFLGKWNEVSDPISRLQCLIMEINGEKK